MPHESSAYWDRVRKSASAAGKFSLLVNPRHFQTEAHMPDSDETEAIDSVERCAGGCGDPARFHDADWCRKRGTPSAAEIADAMETFGSIVEEFGSQHEEQPHEFRLAAKYLREQAAEIERLRARAKENATLREHERRMDPRGSWYGDD